MKKIKRILIANRGEIAVRVIRAARELDIETVAIYSEADKKSLHVVLADRAVEIGAAPPLESYLNLEKIIATAKDNGCQAVHPGYGFLSENAEFSRACREAGLIFIGPPPEAMDLTGDKLRARRAMANAGVPIIPGMDAPTNDFNEMKKWAEQTGYPIMIKASAGGGGKGMRIVHTPDDLESALEAGRREAKSAFGDDTVYLEKFIEHPRHIEFQVLADQHGNIIHLFERECSIQRRHQKIIEETPSPALDEHLRQQMGEAACRVMQTAGYQNAGTVEFLLDAQRNFYFLEVNARIQVEHPVTEAVTGVDLVKQQIHIARSGKLPYRKSDLIQRGHAIECRIYAEDPHNQFLPSTGTLHFVKEPAGPGIRCDSGIYTGLEITPYYDPILSKLIVWDETRDAIIRKMDRALSEYVIFGIQTPISFLRDVINHPEFIKGNLSTRFLTEYFSDWSNNTSEESMELALAAAALVKSGKKLIFTDGGEPKPLSPWQTLGEWEMLKNK